MRERERETGGSGVHYMVFGNHNPLQLFRVTVKSGTSHLSPDIHGAFGHSNNQSVLTPLCANRFTRCIYKPLQRLSDLQTASVCMYKPLQRLSDIRTAAVCRYMPLQRLSDIRTAAACRYMPLPPVWEAYPRTSDFTT